MSVAAATVEGHVPSPHLQADFYAKLSLLQQDILAKKSPRYSLPNPALERLSSIFHGSPASNNAVSSTPLNGHDVFQETFARQSHQRQQVNATPHGTSRPSQTHLHGTKLLSSIDPVLLTKSDDLVRAETVIKRQRLEKLLNEAVSVRKARNRADREKIQDAAVWESPNDVDASAVLEQALSLVKPASGLCSVSTNPISSASSFDNDYYSSKANSWSPEQGANSEKPLTYTVNQGGTPKMPPNETRLLKDFSGNVGNRAYTIARKSDSLAEKLNVPRAAFPNADSGALAVDVGDISQDEANQREESYSPPAADAFAHPNIPPLQNQLQDLLPKLTALNHSAQLPPPPPPPPLRIDLSRTRDSESYSPPAPSAPLPRNGTSMHQLSAASTSHNGNSGQTRSQMKKQSGKKAKKHRKEAVKEVEKATREDLTQGHSNGNVPQLQNPRKRRRDAEATGEEAGRRVSGKRVARTAASPMPYIKPEPVSPPPLALTMPQSNEAPRRLILRDDGHADIEVCPSKGNPASALVSDRRLMPEYLTEDELPSPQYIGRGQYLPQPHTVDTPTVRRRPMQGSNDLRRVASFQHATRPVSPGAYPQYGSEEVQYIRQPSRIVSDRIYPRQPAMYEEADIQAVPQYVPTQRRQPVYAQVDESSPLHFADRQAMPPPPVKRRIVVDEYGDEWIAVPAPSNTRQSMAREMEVTPQYARSQSTRLLPQMSERPARLRQPQVIELDDDEDDYQRRAPLQPSTRQRILRGDDDAMRIMPPPPRMASRAASMAPVMRNPYQRVPTAMGYETEMLGGHSLEQSQQRSYSTRPNAVQQYPFYQRHAEYDPRDSQIIW